MCHGKLIESGLRDVRPNNERNSSASFGKWYNVSEHLLSRMPCKLPNENLCRPAVPQSALTKTLVQKSNKNVASLQDIPRVTPPTSIAALDTFRCEDKTAIRVADRARKSRNETVCTRCMKVPSARRGLPFRELRLIQPIDKIE